MSNTGEGEHDVARRETTDDLDALMESLPPEICERLRGLANRTDLLEVVMDLGRRPQARFTTGEEDLLDREITEADIAHVIDHIGVFGDDNRAGIERTLHRISAIRNRNGKVVGLTCRVGRAVYGTIDIINDFVETGKSILIMGRPGIGKTTMLREAARVLADHFESRLREGGADSDVARAVDPQVLELDAADLDQVLRYLYIAFSRAGGAFDRGARPGGDAQIAGGEAHCGGGVER